MIIYIQIKGNTTKYYGTINLSESLSYIPGYNHFVYS